MLPRGSTKIQIFDIVTTVRALSSAAAAGYLACACVRASTARALSSTTAAGYLACACVRASAARAHLLLLLRATKPATTCINCTRASCCHATDLCWHLCACYLHASVWILCACRHATCHDSVPILQRDDVHQPNLQEGLSAAVSTQTECAVIRKSCINPINSFIILTFTTLITALQPTRTINYWYLSPYS